MGGNVQIQGKGASKLDFRNLSRTKVVSNIFKNFQTFNFLFFDRFGFPLWEDETLIDKKFLSGSTTHLFDLDNITDDEFVKFKPVVGDIDTQVDISLKPQLKALFDTLPIGYKIGNMSFYGYKQSSDQFISLWYLHSLKIDIQIDFELVEFENGKPTPWSVFSHASAWEDIQHDIKGVFHKYLLRAFQARSLQDVIIEPKTLRSKEKRIRSSKLSFSLKGLRQKLSPVLDANDKQVFRDNLPVYIEMPASSYITDLNEMFSIFFDRKGTAEEINKMRSVVGLVELIVDLLPTNDQKKILDGFVNTLWASNAQNLVRGDNKTDFVTKWRAFRYIADRIGGNNDYVNNMIETYYYKGK